MALILGAGGRLGRLLAGAWAAAPPPGLAPLWHARRAGMAPPPELVWDMERDAPPPGAGGVDAVLVLAGVVRGGRGELARNTDLALAGLAAAREWGARHAFLASSGAVYGRGTGPWRETDIPVPRTDYGRAKLAMERAAQVWAAAAGPGAPGLTCLRIGNVAGADAALGAVARVEAGQEPQVLLDRFADGRGPRRAYIGPSTLARVLARLMVLGGGGAALPGVLNIAQPGMVAMADLLAAAGVDWRWRPAPAAALPELGLDVTRLAALIPDLPAADAGALVAQWRAQARAQGQGA